MRSPTGAELQQQALIIRKGFASGLVEHFHVPDFSLPTGSVCWRYCSFQISRLRRHQNKATTERYLQVVDYQLRDVMASLEKSLTQQERDPKAP